MADAKRDANRVPTLIGVSNADLSTPAKIAVDPDTGRMLVQADIFSSTNTGLTDGEAIDVADLLMGVVGSDGTNYQVLKVDSDGNLQVDVLTMPAVTVDLSGDLADLDSGGGTDNHDVIALGVAGSGGHVIITGDAANGLDVDVTRVSGNVAVTNADLTTIAGAVAGTEMQVDIVSMPAVTATNLDIRDLAATQDNVGAKLATDAIMNGVTALTPKFAIIDAATSGDNTLIAAVADKKIRILSGMLVASSAVTVRFESGASGTALTGQMQLASNGGFQIPFCPVGNFETAVNTLLNLELSAAVSVDGWLIYVEV